MDWIKWRLRLPFIMQLLFLGRRRARQVLFYTAVSPSAGRVVTGARKCLVALRELKRHLVYTLVSFCHCSLFSRTWAAACYTAIKAVFHRLLWWKTSKPCLFPAMASRERGSSGVCALVPRQTFSIPSSRHVCYSVAWRTRTSVQEGWYILRHAGVTVMRLNMVSNPSVHPTGGGGGGK